MNYGELKEQIRDLGFGDDDDMEDFGEQIPNKINLAIAEINQFVGGVIGSKEIEIYAKDHEEGFVMVDMLEEDGFLELADLPLVVKKKGKAFYSPFNDFDVRENGNLLFINANNIEGTLKIYYKKAHTKFTTDTDDSVELELPERFQMLVPLLSAYYIWQEDDQTRAIYCYNRYEALASQFMAKPSRVRIKAGGL